MQFFIAANNRIKIDKLKFKKYECAKIDDFFKEKSVANKQNVIQFIYSRLKLWLIEDVAYK